MMTSQMKTYSFIKRKPSVVIVGAGGQQALEYKSLMNGVWDIKALIDPSFELSMCNDSLHHQQMTSVNLDGVDFALVCVPHHKHEDICQYFLERNIPIIKEKPLATCLGSLKKMQTFSNPVVLTTAQRKFNPVFKWAHKNLENLGAIYKFSYEYTLAIPQETGGWRGDFMRSRGGVVLDMGYHMLDVLIRFFGEPSSLYGDLSYCYESMRDSLLEDSASLIYEVQKPTYSLIGSLNINRHGSCKNEELKIYGDRGEMVITPKKGIILDRYGETQSQITLPTNVDCRVDMLNEYANHLYDKAYVKEHLDHHGKIVSCIDKVYKLTRR